MEACVARAGRVRRILVDRVPRLLDIDQAFPREELSVPPVPCRQDAIEEVDPPRNAFHKIVWHAGTHQVPRPIHRQQRSRLLDRVVHDLGGFADAQPADSVGVEPQTHGLARADFPQIRKDPALNDPELGLAAIRDAFFAYHGTNETSPTARCPAKRPLHRGPGFRLGRGVGRAFVEHHSDIRSQAQLRLNRQLRGHIPFGTVEMRPEAYALLVDSTHVAEAEHLVSAAVGKDRSVPTHEPVQAAEPGNEAVARPQQQMIGVRQDHLRTDVDEVPIDNGLDSALSTDGHERRRPHDTMRGAQLCTPRMTVMVRHAKLESRRHCGILADDVRRRPVARTGGSGHTATFEPSNRTLQDVKRLRVGVIYGGRSGEHEVSLASAASVIAGLDRDRYEPIPIRIERNGRWTLADRPPTALSAADVIEQSRLETARVVRPARETYLLPRPGDENLLTIERGTHAGQDSYERAIVTGVGLDVVFPVLHGPYGEDGTIQGLLELANVPYVGAGVLASSTGMDKTIMKVLFAGRRLPIVKHVVIRRHEWIADRAAAVRTILDRITLPAFVKPANLGSSVGVSKAGDEPGLCTAVDLAADFDRKIIIEAAVPEAREIECAVIGNDDPEVSVPGEIIPAREFYDYEAKYLDSTSLLIVPAELAPNRTATIQRLAREAFLAIDGAGLARVDFLLAGQSGEIYVSEVNTIPGFTTISMFAKLWAASGIEYPVLLDRLIQLALERYTAKQQLRTSFL